MTTSPSPILPTGGTGGTGGLGRHVLPMPRDAGRTVRVLSRHGRESADDGVEHVTGAYRAGGNLTLEGADTGGRTWEDFLAERAG